MAGIHNPQNITNLDCSFLEYEVINERLQRYIKIRDKSFELIIIESAYFNWSIQNGTFELTQANYEENLNIYLDILAAHIFNVIEIENSAQAAELGDSTNLSHKITEYSKYLKITIYSSPKKL